MLSRKVNTALDLLDIFTKIIDKIKNNHNPISIEDFLQLNSAEIDKYIINYCKENNVKSIGGEAFFKTTENNNHIIFQFDMYFSKPTNEIVKLSKTKQISKSIFTEDSIEKIENSSLKYPINPPQDN